MLKWRLRQKCLLMAAIPSYLAATIAAASPDGASTREEAVHPAPAHPSRLRSAEDALDVIALALSDNPDAGTVLLVDRPLPAEGFVIPVVDDVDGELVDRLDALVLEAMDSEPGCRIVLAARRREGLTMVEEADLRRWRRLQARHAATAIPLLDWFVLSAPVVFSMAEIAGPPANWAPA